MSTLAIVLIVLAVLIVLLIAGGLVANARRSAADDPSLRADLAAADEALALARAQDRGWERSALEAAALEAFAQRSPAEVRELHLVQVVDRAGTDEDRAVFRVVAADGTHELTLDREGDAWVGV